MKIFRAVNNFSVSQQVSYTGCDYEEIKDTHKQLPTNPSDSSNTIYATAQLPTNPSDSSYTVYTTVQKATGDSQILITSAEDLNYSVVNFHKKADCPDSVILRNNQDYSEYAAVNHLTAWRATAEDVNELKDLILSSDFHDWHFCGLPLSFWSVSDVNKYWILKQNMQLWSVS